MLLRKKITQQNYSTEMIYILKEFYIKYFEFYYLFNYFTKLFTLQTF